MVYDVAVIGGGAAGLMSAIYIKKKAPALSVAVVESLDRVGKKLITTGNGRCNITNKNATVLDYHGGERGFLQRVFDRFFVDDAVEFFKSIGVETVFEADGKGYPASYQASSVVDALRLTCDELGVDTVCSFAVKNIVKRDVFTLMSDGGRINAGTVIATGGLLSGGAKVGSDGSVLGIAKRLGHKTVAITPAIVQLKTNTEITRQLKGIKINAGVSLVRAGQPLRREQGEVLFTDYGLSGPPILQLSRNADSGCEIVLDLLPDIDRNTLCDMLKNRSRTLSRRTVDNYLVGFINKRVGQVVLKCSGLKMTDSAGAITNHADIAGLLKGLRFRVVGSTGFSNSQVSAGGIAVGELTDDLESRRVRGLFFAGEIIDIDGDCGGFNLQWAWSSAAVAAEGVLKCF